MKKSDKSIRSITLASIKRSLMPTAICKYTKTFESELISDIPLVDNTIKAELPVACTFVDNNNYTLVTTQRVITQKEGTRHTVLFQNIKSFTLGDFKGFNDSPITCDSVVDAYETTIPVLIETGKASMIIVNAIRTIMNLIKEVPA